jgi:regulation of enolase protein 1 (concanavalin A-like superfamily)
MIIIRIKEILIEQVFITEDIGIMISMEKKQWFEVGLRIGVGIILFVTVTAAYLYSWILIYP